MRRLEVLSRVASSPARDDEGCMTRRAILATLAAAALTACSSSTVVTGPSDSGAAPDDAGTDDAGGDPACGPTTGDGAVTTYPQGTWKAAGLYIIGHDAGGLFAFSTTCTHRGCIVGAPSATGETLCPCHGARYDGNGAVIGGPAPSPLPHFAVKVCGGNVFVDPTATVPATTRTAAG